MQIPPGITAASNMVCRLRKSLYGLRQASRKWFEKLVSELLLQYFVQSKNDYSLFIKKSGDHIGDHITILVVHVDDIIVTGNDLSTISHIKTHLDTVFSIKDLGKLNYFLGIEVCYYDTGIALTQHKCTKELLQDCFIDH